MHFTWNVFQKIYSAHGWSLHSMRGLGGREWTPDMGHRLQRQWSRSTLPSLCNISHTPTPIADPPLVDMITNVVRVRSVKGNTEEFSFAGVHLTFLLISIVLIILCINFLIIGISVIIWRWRILRQYFLENIIFGSDRSPRGGDLVHACVCPCGILLKWSLKMSSSKHSREFRGVLGQASGQASRQSVGRHSVRAMPWRGLFKLDWKREEERRCTFPATRAAAAGVAGSALRAPWWGATWACPLPLWATWAPWTPVRTRSRTRRRLSYEKVNTITNCVLTTKLL